MAQNPHLGLYAAERRTQARELISNRWLAHPDLRGPIVFCGDLDAIPRSRTLELMKTQLSDAQFMVPGKILHTFAGRVPTLCIDHILVRDIDAVSRVVVPSTELTRLASDHLPLVADLSISL